MLRTTLAAPAAPRAAPSRAVPPPRRAGVRAAVAVKDPADNLKEAQEWVARWRARQAANGGGRSGSGSDSDAPARRAAAAPAAAASGGKGGKLQPCKSFSDGTLLFTADSLKAVKFSDVKL
jgi:hypothetical protein